MRKGLTQFGWFFQCWAVQKLVNLADLVKNFQTSIRGHEEDLGLHQVAQAQRREDHQARQCAEGGVPGGEPRHVEDGRLCQQAPVLRPWASPGDSAEEFRLRAGLSSRDLKSWTRVTVDGLRNLMILLDCVFYFCRRSGHAHSSGGWRVAGYQNRNHYGESEWQPSRFSESFEDANCGAVRFVVRRVVAPRQ